MDHTKLFERSQTLSLAVESHILKMILGPRFADNTQLAEKQREYREGLMDDYNCFLYIPQMPNAAPQDLKRAQQHFSYIKIKDIRKYMFEVFTDELYPLLDIDEFVKSEIESKAIVVIDEIDKLVRSVSGRYFLNCEG
jgi:hypothetical protein